MLQEGGLYPGVRPLEALQLFASYYDDPDDPERLLDLVGLDDSAHTLVRRMSGGQQQRLSLAFALVGRPALVFLDEPTAGMDPHARATTWTLIRELRDRGATVVLTTHAMDEAEHLCDRVGIIDHGRLVACDSPAELTTRAAADEMTFSTVTGLAVDRLARRARPRDPAPCASCARASTWSTPRRRRRWSPSSPRGCASRAPCVQRAAGRAPQSRGRVPPAHRRRTLVRARR